MFRKKDFKSDKPFERTSEISFQSTQNLENIENLNGQRDRSIRTEITV